MRAGPPCRADHIGSLLRPLRLRDAYKASAAGRMGAAEFDAVLDDSIRAVIRMQEDAGLGVVTDGEFRRRSWFAGFVDAVDGLEHRDTAFQFVADGAAQLSVPVPHTAGPIRRTRGIATRELAFARERRAAAGEDHPARALGHPLPPRAGGDRPRRLSRRGSVVAGPDRCLPRRDRRARAARLRLSPARRGADRAALRSAHPGADRRVGLGLARTARSLPVGERRGAARPARPA